MDVMRSFPLLAGVLVTACSSSEFGVAVDSGDLDKKVARQKNRAEAWRAHEKELNDFRVEVVDTKDALGLKQIKVRLTGKKLAQEGEEWKVVDRKDERTFVLTQIEGKWRVK